MSGGRAAKKAEFKKRKADPSLCPARAGTPLGVKFSGHLRQGQSLGWRGRLALGERYDEAKSSVRIGETHDFVIHEAGAFGRGNHSNFTNVLASLRIDNPDG